MKNRKIYVVDLFSGAGGTSTGAHLASKNVEVIACANHDAEAIESHRLNHPKCKHFTEDIRNFDLVPKIKKLVDAKRKKEPDCIILLWASLECTNFSKAKGGLPRDADSRTLAEHMYMYITTLDPDYFYVENVREFMSWGPLDKNGKPVSKTEGQDFVRWCEYIRRMGKGYSMDKKLLNSADYDAYQARVRLFIIFAKKDMSTCWPLQTNTKDKNSSQGLFPMKKWNAVKDVLDLEDEGKSIFDREKAYSENTEKRVLAGLLKFVVNKGEKQFRYRYNGGNPEHKVASLEQPMGTVLTNNTHAIVSTDKIVKIPFLKKYFSGRPEGKVISVYGPCGTIKTVDGHALVTSSHINTYYGKSNPQDIENPSPVVTTKDRISKVDVKFMIDYQGKETNHDIDKPCPTVMTKDKFSLVDLNYIMSHYTNGGFVSSIDKPCQTITGNPKQNIVSANQFLVNPQFDSKGKSVDEPCFTIIARMDKKPPSLVNVLQGELVWIFVYEHDSPTMVEIKKIMAEHGIVDIKMRMLKINELKRIQGFPEDYKLVGTQTNQKKFIGNAVEVNTAKALIGALNLHYNKN